MKKNDSVTLNAAALQDHYTRLIKQKINILPKIKPLKTSIIQNNARNILQSIEKTKNLNQSSKEKIEFENKWNQYYNNLSLAQKMGLVPAPPQPLSLEKWQIIEEQARKRHDFEGICPICLSEFKIEEQIILSCSHVFHKNCLFSFENHTKSKVCPICRKNDYDKKETKNGFNAYRNKCVIKIQKIVRGFFARKYFFEKMGVNRENIKNKRLKRAFIFYNMKRIGKKIDKKLVNKEKNSEKFMNNVDNAMKINSEAIYNKLEALQIRSTENKIVLNEILENQYPSNNNKPIKNEYKINEKWTEIKEKALKRCDQDCTICLNNLYVQKELCLLSCSHLFHIHCINSLERYSLDGKAICPICRVQYEKIHLKLFI